ncbi:hypothetical protein Nepgr_033101 [Nepenthes gracilis]|uniref:Uncharacterized protein n=1 Tax=Nepenthes gracilis TaxID=150966 RepID=A0AAD3Y6M7_NEPGR|nr:hypothetical protein Nepgr_033101 [Nepenthes gracilis]
MRSSSTGQRRPRVPAATTRPILPGTARAGILSREAPDHCGGEIEDLIWCGHLKRFVKSSGQEPTTSDGEASEPPRARTAAGVVHMVSSTDAADTRHGQPEATFSNKRAKIGVKNDVISFSSDDMAHVTSPHTDPLVVLALVSTGEDDYQLKRVFIDNRSSQNLLYLTAFFKLGLKRSQMKAASGPLYGLDNEPVPVQGIVRLEVTMGTHLRSMMRELAFLVVDLPSVYNAILGRPILTTFEAVTSIPHLKVKFPTPWGVGEVLGDQEMGRTCYLSQINPVGPCCPDEDLDLRDETSLQQAQSGEETEAIPLNPSEPERCINVRRSLQPVERDRLITFLRANSDVFARIPADMPGIPAEVIVHKLGLDWSRKPVRQKRRNHSVEKLVAIREEVKRLWTLDSSEKSSIRSGCPTSCW